MNKHRKLKDYKNLNILITGGLGFIGSNIAHKLVTLGANVTIIDNLAPLYGGNKFNIKGIEERVKFVKGDVRDQEKIAKLVKNKNIIFHLAAQVSPIDSTSMPFDDLDINCRGYINILEECRKSNKDAKIIFSSSRLALGKITENIVTETHPAHPLNFYGIHKLASEKYSYVYHKTYGLKTTVLRLTNPYGERQQIKHSKYSIPGWFMRQAMEGGTIKIFGDGKQKRDYIHIADLVDAFLLAGISDNTSGKLYNCGYGRSIEFRTMVENIVKIVRNGKVEYVPWPSNYANEETGDFETSIKNIFNDTGWKPKTSIEKGLKQMFNYYKKHSKQYIPKNN
jgi:UDP-glucose 4-epimerase